MFNKPIRLKGRWATIVRRFNSRRRLKAVSRADAKSRRMRRPRVWHWIERRSCDGGNALQPGSAILIGNIEGCRRCRTCAASVSHRPTSGAGGVHQHEDRAKSRAFATLNRESHLVSGGRSICKSRFESRAPTPALPSRSASKRRRPRGLWWRFNGVQWLYLWPSAPGGFSFTSDASKAPALHAAKMPKLRFSGRAIPMRRVGQSAPLPGMV